MRTPARYAAVALILLLAAYVVLAQRQGQPRPPKPEPTHADVSYGDHEQQAFDIWLAEADEPTPLVMFIHGGGFRAGSKDQLAANVLTRYVDAGISVAAIEYRFTQHKRLPAAHEDCVRAVQLIRAKAGEWNLDKSRFGAFGGSAGAQLCMYLAFHDDLADPDSEDPIARESTRLLCVATNGGQTSMHFDWWKEHIPGYETPHRDPAEVFDAETQEEIDAIVEEISALSLISEDDPPIWMGYGMSPDDPIPDEPGKVQGWKVHHVNFGVALKEKTDELGIEAVLVYPGQGNEPGAREKFLIEKLTAE